MVDFHSLNLWMDRHLLHVWGDEDPFAMYLVGHQRPKVLTIGP